MMTTPAQAQGFVADVDPDRWDRVYKAISVADLQPGQMNVKKAEEILKQKLTWVNKSEAQKSCLKAGRNGPYLTLITSDKTTGNIDTFELTPTPSLGLRSCLASPQFNTWIQPLPEQTKPERLVLGLTVEQLKELLGPPDLESKKSLRYNLENPQLKQKLTIEVGIKAGKADRVRVAVQTQSE